GIGTAPPAQPALGNTAGQAASPASACPQPCPAATTSSSGAVGAPVPPSRSCPPPCPGPKACPPPCPSAAPNGQPSCTPPCSYEPAASGPAAGAFAPCPAPSGVEGRVTAGPTCPVQRADQPCPDKPVETTLRLLRQDGSV